MNLTIENLYPKNNKYIIIVAWIACTIPMYANGFYNIKLESNPSLFWAIDFFSWIVMPFTCFVSLYKYDILDLGYFGLIGSPIRWSWLIILSIITAFVAPLLSIFIDNNFRAIFPLTFLYIPFSYEYMIPHNTSLRIAGTLYLAVTASIVEEILFRTLTYKYFANNIIGRIAYITFTSLLFSFAHWESDIYGMFNIFIWGVCASTLYILVKSIWPIIIGHLAIDLAVYLSLNDYLTTLIQ